jgi:hypothetical protein
LGDVLPHALFDVFVGSRRARVRERCAREKPLASNLAFGTHGFRISTRAEAGA